MEPKTVVLYKLEDGNRGQWEKNAKGPSHRTKKKKEYHHKLKEGE